MGSDYEGPLDALRWHWGDAYLISFFAPDNWVAQRRDSHATIGAKSAYDLRDLIVADYDAHPVPRSADRQQAPSCRFLPGG